MLLQLKSDTAKAEVVSYIAKCESAEKALQEAQNNSPIQSRRDIRAFWVQYPKTRDLYGLILPTWRQSKAYRPFRVGYWAAYPYPWWSEKSKLPIATLKRHLNLLQGFGLIERERGQFGGRRVLTFIRPTELSLGLSSPRPQDWDHLGYKADSDEPGN